jgi:hypothetical protein
VPVTELELYLKGQLPLEEIRERVGDLDDPVSAKQIRRE